jgi:hypothetical protein
MSKALAVALDQLAGLGASRGELPDLTGLWLSF